ncbi:hypothetical protein SNOG_09342 [Parastagonospora nodorum SN15]|uniref:Uncharacterized protein n=1 Tax=Phaeosphaeria nodorum (strain SN15 / ATCC MYA-4574 / FGSC 10173) TaxID=321614 RepID=Q0UFX2_PHANO|nr:hypothetical protein SNOG_09342 [Parastagonospora nodorum SN15]EAT83534.1 hypothetical protein SNOG_09342 [Parastagonospora nodorum SN15]
MHIWLNGGSERQRIPKLPGPRVHASSILPSPLGAHPTSNSESPQMPLQIEMGACVDDKPRLTTDHSDLVWPKTWDFLEMSPGWCLDGRPLKQQLRSRTTDTGPQQFWKRLRWWYDPLGRRGRRMPPWDFSITAKTP